VLDIFKSSNVFVDIFKQLLYVASKA